MSWVRSLATVEKALVTPSPKTTTVTSRNTVCWGSKFNSSHDIKRLINVAVDIDVEFKAHLLRDRCQIKRSKSKATLILVKSYFVFKIISTFRTIYKLLIWRFPQPLCKRSSTHLWCGLPPVHRWCGCSAVQLHAREGGSAARPSGEGSGGRGERREGGEVTMSAGPRTTQYSR